MARAARRERIYKVLFVNQGKVYEVYCEGVQHGAMLGFVEMEGLLFGEKTKLVVDPSEEALKQEFSGVSRTFVPMHAVIRIDEVARAGVTRIRGAAEGMTNVVALPTLVKPDGPGKREP